jgi:Lar family restriction alleviation protein
MPCPFCGCDAMPLYNQKHFIRCNECDVETKFYNSPEDAAKAWNSRTGQTERRLYVKPDSRYGPASGGIRVDHVGLIEVTEDSTVIWGLHNQVKGVREVGAGYIFNCWGTGGLSGWFDVVPRYFRKDGIYYKKAPEHINCEEMETILNQKQIYQRIIQ